VPNTSNTATVLTKAAFRIIRNGANKIAVEVKEWAVAAGLGKNGLQA
jgi:hypothetical protein